MKKWEKDDGTICTVDNGQVNIGDNYGSASCTYQEFLDDSDELSVTSIIKMKFGEETLKEVQDHVEKLHGKKEEATKKQNPFNPGALLETCEMSIKTCNVTADVPALIKEISDGIDAGYDINKLDQYGGTLLIDAADRGVEEACLMLLEKDGVDIHVKGTSYGRNAIHWAAGSGLYKTVAKLIEMGGEFDLVDNGGFTPLAMACLNAHKHHLLNYTVKDSSGKEIKDHPKTKEVANDYDAFTKIVELLLEKGANVDPIIAKTNQNPVFFQAEHSDVDILKLLIKAGADVNHKDKWGLTPIFLACRNGGNVQGEEILELLIDAGANINHQDDCGFTSLIEAVMGNHIKAVQLMLKHGADKSLKLTTGYAPYTNHETALDIARDKGFKEIEELLK